jgi:hypothetical protein
MTGKPSQADQLVALVASANVELFTAIDGRAFASFDVLDANPVASRPGIRLVATGHRETWPLRSGAFRNWMSHEFYLAVDKAPASQAIADALVALEGRARFAGDVIPVHVRLARHEDDIYLDLGDPRWQAIRISGGTWSVVPNPPVRFRRPAGLRSLPVPVHGGSLAELRDLVNVGSDESFVLMVGWLVGTLNPDIPFPVLDLIGEQGAAKSTTARILRQIVDPNASPLRSLPRDERDLGIAASSRWIVAFDNLSDLRPWISDGICRLATGGGIATRTLYSDDDETVFDVRRPVILNGIEDVAVRSDLLDRAIVIELPRVPDERRRTEAEIDAEFVGAWPRLLGAVLDAAAAALAALPSTHLERPPRMADFARWVVAGETPLPWGVRGVPQRIRSQPGEFARDGPRGVADLVRPRDLPRDDRGEVDWHAHGSARHPQSEGRR